MPAVGGDNGERIEIVFDQFWNIRAAALLESLEDFDLVGATQVRVSSTKDLVDLSFEVDADVGTDPVFELSHEEN